MASHVTDQNFDEAVMKHKGFFIVDMYADWCGPCKMMAPVIDELAKAHEGKVNIVKLNVDENQETSSKFGVSSIPTILFIKDGKEIDRLVGFQSKEAMEKKIAEHT